MENDEMVKFRLKLTIEHCDKILNDLKNLSLEEFMKSDLLCRATTYTLGNISEQITRLKDKFSATYPEIEWKKIYNLRILESHIYWKTNFKVIYQIATIDLPKLKNQIERIYNEFCGVNLN